MEALHKHNRISILTFNTLGTPFFAPDISKRFRRTAHLINIGDYDIVCLQELFTYYHFYTFKSILKNFPYAVYQKTSFGPRGGLAIFSKVPLVNPQYFSYTNPKNVFIPIYDKVVRHGILSAQLENTNIKIVTTHLSSDTTHVLTPENKLYPLISVQAKELADFIHKNKSFSSIIALDFNIAKHSVLYEKFLKETSVSDVFDKDEVPTYYPDRVSYFYQSPQSRIDFIFVKSVHKNFKIIKTDTAFVEKETLANGKKSFLSDHIGLHCILEVNE